MSRSKRELADLRLGWEQLRAYFAEQAEVEGAQIISMRNPDSRTHAEGRVEAFKEVIAWMDDDDANAPERKDSR